MPDTSIKHARAAVLAERERIWATIRELEEQLAEIDQAVASLGRLIDDSDASVRRGRGGGGRDGRTARIRSAKRQPPRRTRGGEPTMVSLIESYLAEQGRKATHADEVMWHLHSIDRAPSGKNPKATVQATLAQLQKRGCVKNVGKNRWRFVRSGGTRRASTGAGDDAA